MTLYRGGPRHDQEVEEEHTHADEVRITYKLFDEKLNPLGEEKHLYKPDSFGNLVYQGLV